MQSASKAVKRLPGNAPLVAVEEVVRNSILRECRGFNRRKPEVIVSAPPMPCPAAGAALRRKPAPDARSLPQLSVAWHDARLHALPVYGCKPLCICTSP